jgi:Tfp pilus assembly PilM family ATPase
MSTLADRFSLTRSAAPSVAVEIAANRVSAATLEKRGDRFAVSAHATEPLPPAAVAASLTAQNVREPVLVSRAVERVLEKVGGHQRVGLIIPDPAVKVSILKLEEVPSRRTDLDQLVRWQMRKAAPFAIEDAQLSYVKGAMAVDGQEFIVSVARRQVIEEYEATCKMAGAHAGLVDISTFNVINGLIGGDPPERDWLLINVAVDYATIAIVRGQHPVFFRSRTDHAEGSLADIVHQTAMYYEDRLKGTGLTRAVLCGAAEAAKDPAEVREIRQSFEGRLGIKVEMADIGRLAPLGDRVAAAPALLDTLAPLVGLLLRGRHA